MKLSEKIYQCRKKAGLSQEALAVRLGVSRQAVSKWELGDAEPEPAKLKLLADTFHVSVDWLLSPDETEYAPPRQDPPAQPQHPLPGELGHLARRYGWLAGLYVILVGVGGMAVGVLSRVLVRNLFLPPVSGPVSQEYNQAVSNFLAHNPVYLIGGVIFVVGAVVTVAGMILTIVLKRRSKQG